MEATTTILKTAHPAKILEWKHQPFLVEQSERNFYYELGTRQPDIFDGSFHLTVTLIMIFCSLNREVFNAKVESSFEIGYRHDAPSIEFLFDLICGATVEFAKIFNKKVQLTNLMYYPVPKPSIDFLRASIQEVIDYWDAPVKKFKENGGERLEQFKNLPAVPYHKRYNGGNTTNEQKILRKLDTHQEVDSEERVILEELDEFYGELNKQLVALDYKSFNGRDLQDFKNYILYVFNAYYLISNQATIVGDLFRLVVNEKVTGENKTINEVRFLTYPSLEVVKKNAKFNRASTDNSTLLYLASTIDTALKEIHPPINKLVTIGVWAPKEKRTFTQFPIEHSEEAAKVNSDVANGIQALKEYGQHHDPLLGKYMKNYFDLLSREYSKSVAPENHYEYMLSAILSEKIFEIEKGNHDFNFEFISYPSVGNSFITKNLAVKPTVADNEFKIIQVKEFEIEESYYEKTAIESLSTECISVAKIKNYRETFDISDDGRINW
jgi:hypothetical protein